MSIISMPNISLAAHERRRFARHDVGASGTANSVRETFDVQILDVSRGGACLRSSDARLAVGDWLSVQLARMRIFRSQVVWIKSDRVGVRFLESPEIVASRLSTYNV